MTSLHLVNVSNVNKLISMNRIFLFTFDTLATWNDVIMIWILTLLYHTLVVKYKLFGWSDACIQLLVEEVSLTFACMKLFSYICIMHVQANSVLSEE